MLLVNQVPALSLRFMAPHLGAWIVEADLDLGSDQALPTGKVSVTVGTSTLVGTIDPDATGRFGEKAKARVVAGGNGWRTPPRKQNLHNDAGAGVTSADVLASTAPQVGETGVDNAVVSYGPDFDLIDTRPASQIFDGRLWHVDAQGLTQAGLDWPSLPLGKDVDVLDFDPKAQRAAFASDELVWPGTMVSGDARFSDFTVRSVDQSFTAEGGSRGFMYLGPELDELLDAFVEGFGDPHFVSAFEYRVVQQGSDGRLQLQAVNKSSGIPDSLLVPVWPGVPGVTAKHKPGSTVHVIFVENDRTKPRIVHFDGSSPLELHFDAATLIQLGANAVHHAAFGEVTDANFSALKTFAIALNAYAVAIQAVADPTNAATPTLTAAAAAFEAALEPTAALKTEVE